MLYTPVLVVSVHAGSSLLGMALGAGAFEIKELVESQVKEKHSKGGGARRGSRGCARRTSKIISALLWMVWPEWRPVTGA